MKQTSGRAESRRDPEDLACARSNAVIGHVDRGLGVLLNTTERLIAVF